MCSIRARQFAIDESHQTNALGHVTAPQGKFSLDKHLIAGHRICSSDKLQKCQRQLQSPAPDLSSNVNAETGQDVGRQTEDPALDELLLA